MSNPGKAERGSGFGNVNFGFVLKELAKAIEADRPALIQGERIVSWGELDRASDAIAHALRARGLKAGDAAGQMLRNTPDYLLAFFGCIKAGVIPVNINYHYKARELTDICTRFGLKGLFVESDFASAGLAAMPQDALILDVGTPEWRKICAETAPADFTAHDDPEALFYVATGGTTGMPKAVMWPFSASWAANSIGVWQKPPPEPPFVPALLADHIAEAKRITPDHPANGSPVIVLSPLMHGAGLFNALIALLKGGTVTMLPVPKFDADMALTEIARLKVRSAFIVGDAFALPLIAALEDCGDPASVFASMRVLISTGAALSEENKQKLLRLVPHLTIVDALGSSESSGTAVVVTTAQGSTGGGKFSALPGRNTKLFAQDLTPIEPGDARVGMVARTGPLPLGYLGEDEKNAQTFPVIDGERYLMTGDQARWTGEGTLEFVGRDNMCINTGGEKVFPEEVETVLLSRSEVKEARVVGIADARFGQKVVAVVMPQEAELAGSAADDLIGVLDAHARDNMAGYKIPRAYVFTRDPMRLNNGKPDYKTAQRLAEELVT
jgi:fatty-acyl-CoA synthase